MRVFSEMTSTNSRKSFECLTKPSLDCIKHSGIASCVCSQSGLGKALSSGWAGKIRISLFLKTLQLSLPDISWILNYEDRPAACSLSPSQPLCDLQRHHDTGWFPNDKLGNNSSCRHLLLHICLALWMLFACVNRSVANHPPSERWDGERRPCMEFIEIFLVSWHPCWISQCSV